MQVTKQVTWKNLVKSYIVEDSDQASYVALDQFRKDFADKIPPYKKGTSFSRYFGKFFVETVK